MCQLLAKRREDGVFQTLEEHICDCEKVLESFLRQPFFRSFCNRWDISPHLAEDNLRWAVRLHDIGKAGLDFQKAIREDKKADVSHRLIALPVAYEVLKKEKVKDILGEDEPLLILALILAHHSALYSGVFTSEPSRTIRFHPAIRQLFPQISQSMMQISVEEGKKMVRNLEELLHKCSRERGEVYTKSIFAYFLSLLKLSDWLASKAFAENKIPQPPLFSSPSEEAIFKDKTPYPFQRQLSKSSNPFLVLRAPCGRGKTESAILWFLNLWKRGEVERLIFAMPTQVTSNAMRERLAGIFGEENVGLYHGRSYLEITEIQKLRLEISDEEFEEDDFLPLLKEENLWGEIMGKPVVVTTVDHILYSFVHGFPQADFAFGNLQTAGIVFDEVHSYDYLMLAHLREAFKLLRQMKIPHLLMSATLPQFLFKELGVEEYPLIEDEEGKKIVRFSLRKREEFLIDGEGNMNEKVLDEIEKRHKKGEKQFIILNTVRRAQRVYRQLKKRDLKVVLLHSRFAYAHRRKKERYIIEKLQTEEPLILVATQVIEVSLDISSHTLYTELAPLDAIFQRAGRLNRKAMEGDYKLFLFQPVDYNPYREKKEILDKSWKLLEERALTQGDLEKLTSIAYEGVELKMVSRLPRLFRETVIFGHSPKEIRYSEEEGRAFHTREIEQPTVDVIPYDIFISIEKEDIGALLLHLTPVPIWWVAYSLKEGKGLFFPHSIRSLRFLICRLPYDEEVGFEEEKLGEIGPSTGGVFID